MKRHKFRAEAQFDIVEATTWYETERDGLGFELHQHIERACERAAEHPRLFAVSHRDVRRALVDRFPYAVFFQETDDGVLIVAVTHLHRDPDLAKGR